MQKDDVIYRQAAIDVIEAGRLTKLIDAETAVNGLKELPSAQLEIVRCKDCKYNVSSHKCLHPESFFLVPDDDFYCGYAERRTNATN